MLFFYIILSFYLLFLICIVGAYFFKDKIATAIESKQALFLSVVIPVKDEPNLKDLINDLLTQSLSQEKFEIFVIDDHSKEEVNLPAPVQVINQGQRQAGKKAALTTGIKNAKGEIIVTIDGDCRVETDFLKNIYTLFSTSSVVLSPGLINYSPVSKLFHKLQAIENYAIMGTGVALDAMGATSLSNGANLAFRKQVWQEAGGYELHENIPSGDDEFFVQSVAKRYPDRIYFRKSAADIVNTKPHDHFINFFNQRIRWAGKWKFYFDKKMIIVAALVFLFHVGICGALIQLFTTLDSILFSLFAVKLLFEGLLILSIAKRMKSPFFIFSFIILQFLYSPYVVFFGLTANFVSYSWKGRRFRY